MTSDQLGDILGAIGMAGKLVLSVGPDVLEEATSLLGQAIFQAPSTRIVKDLERQRRILDAAKVFGAVLMDEMNQSMTERGGKPS